MTVPRHRRHPQSGPLSARRLALLFGLTFAAGLLIFVARRPWLPCVEVDWAYRELEGQAIRRGEVPYRDFFLHKGPLGGYEAALGQAAAVAVGADPLLGSRGLNMVVAAATAAFLGCLLATATGSAAAGGLGGLVLLTFNYYGMSATSGVEPKTGMACCAFAALLAFQRRRLVLAGALAAVGTLFWQMGLLALLVLLVELAWQRRPGQDWLRLVAGYMLPIAAMSAYFATQGALRAAWEDAVLFNLPYAQMYARGPFGSLWFALKVWTFTYGCDLDFLALSLVGILAYAWGGQAARGRPVRRIRLPAVLRRQIAAREPEVIRVAALDASHGAERGPGPSEIAAPHVPLLGIARRPRPILMGITGRLLPRLRTAPAATRPPSALTHAGRPLLVLGAVSTLMLLVNMQDSSDTLFVLPYLAAFAGLGLCGILKRLWRVATADGNRLAAVTWPRAYGAAALLLVGYAVTRGLLTYFPTTLPAQREALTRALAGTQGPIYAVAAPEALVLTGRRSVSKYWYLYNGVAQWIEAREPGGLAGEIARVEAAKPEVVICDRTARWDPAYRPFWVWLYRNYHLEGRYYHRYYYHPQGGGLIATALRPLLDRGDDPWLPGERAEAQTHVWRRDRGRVP